MDRFVAMSTRVGPGSVLPVAPNSSRNRPHQTMTADVAAVEAF